MAVQRSRKRRRPRIPLTITLDEATYDFICSSAALREFRSLDEFFSAALTVYSQHLSALREYIELQESKGLSREEALCLAQCEIVFTQAH